jgi:fibronectin-binding autotransporter adhesin
LWVSGSDAVFSAGSDGTGAINVMLPASETLHNLTVSAGSVTLSGAGLSLSSLTTSATWTTHPAAALNVQSSISANGNVLTVGGGGCATFGGVITTTRGLNLSGSGSLVLTANNSLAGGVAVQAGTLVVENAEALGPGGSGNDTTVTAGASFWLQNAGNINNVVLTMGGSGPSGSGALQLLQGNSTWSGPVLLSADTLVNTASGSLTLSGYLLGGFNVTKTGSGTLALSGSNAAGFFGSINVQAGTLDVSNGGALGLSVGGGTVAVANGATLAVHGGISIPAEPLTLAGGGLSGGGALRNTADANALASPVTLGVSTGIGVDGGTLTLSGALGGNGGLLKSGSGVLVLANTTSTYAGAPSVASGTLVIPLFNNTNSAGPLGGGSGPLSLATNGAAAVEYTGPTANSNRTIVLATGGTGTVQIDSATANLTLSGSISGGGGLAKTGPGELTLAGSASYTGGTQVGSGTLAISAAASLNGTSAISIAQGATLTIVNSGASQLSPATNITLSGGNLLFSADGSVNGGATAGALVLSAGQNSISASRTGGTLYTPVLHFTGSPPTPAIGATATFSATLPQIEFASSPTLLNGILGGGTFYGTSDFATCTTSAPYTILPLATYTTGDLGQLPSSAAMNVMPSGTQSTVTAAKLANSLNLSGSEGVTISGSGSLVLTSGGILANTTGTISGGTLAGSANGSLVVNTVKDVSVTGVIADNGGGTLLVKTGAATLTLTGVNTYSGNTYINQGVLQLAPTANLAYAKTIYGYGDLVKAGTATLTLSGSNALRGTTTIAAGNLCVNGSLPSTSTVYLESGVLSGNGIVGGNVVTSGGAIAFASTAGNIAGTVAATSGTLSIGQAGTGNYLTTVGGLTMSGTSVLTASPSTAGTIIGSVTYASSSSSTYSGAISGSASVLTLEAPACTTLTLSNTAADSFGGTVIDSGVLKIANAAALNNTSMTLDGGRLDMNGLNLSFAELAGGGGTVSTSQTGGSTLIVAPASGVSSQYYGSIANGSGTVALLKSGDGRLILSGNDSSSGGTVVSDGVLELTTPSAVAAGTSLIVGSPSAFAPIVPAAASPIEPASVPGSPQAVSPVPEPSALALFITGLAGLGFVTLRKRIGGIHRG